MMRLIPLCFVALLWCGDSAAQLVTLAEERAMNKVVNQMLVCFKTKDLDKLKTLIESDFKLMKRFQGGRRQAIDHDSYLREVNDRFSKISSYKHELRNPQVFLLDGDEGYGLTTRVSDRYLLDGIYERDNYGLTAHFRKTDTGFKIYKLLYQD